MARVTSSTQRDCETRSTLVLADGHPIVLQGMQRVFSAKPEFTVLACCTSEDETIQVVRERRPDILILDWHLPLRGGMAVLRALAQTAAPTRVVLLTDNIKEHEVLEAVRLGIKGVVLKEMTALLLLQCIRQVARGQMWIENRTFAGVAQRMLGDEARIRSLRQRLTPREFQIMQLVGEGLRNKDITARLNITEGTVKIHLHNIYAKFGTNDRLQLALLARDERIA